MSINDTHTKKLNKFGLSQPNFEFVNQVIFNYSSYSLSKKKKKVSSLSGPGFQPPSF